MECPEPRECGQKGLRRSSGPISPESHTENFTEGENPEGWMRSSNPTIPKYTFCIYLLINGGRRGDGIESGGGKELSKKFLATAFGEEGMKDFYICILEMCCNLNCAAGYSTDSAVNIF